MRFSLNPLNPLTALLMVLVLVLSGGCLRGCKSSRPPIHPNPNMDYQPKLEPFEASSFFYDGIAMRAPVPGTVARGQLIENDVVTTGRDPGGNFVAVNPVPLDDNVIARGMDRFVIYCAPCHTERGDGRGILYERGNVPTTSLHDPRVVGLTDGELYDVITNGKGLMTGYRYPIRTHDRWAIVAYVRELQKREAERQAGS